MKRFLAMAVSVLLVLGAVPAFAATQEEGLQKAIETVKSMVDIPEELSEFTYENSEYRDELVWRLEWNTEDGERSVNVSITDSGILTGYSYYDFSSEKSSDGIAKVSKADAQAAAQAFLQRVMGDTYASVRLDDSQPAYSGFAFQFHQYVNDVMVVDHYMDVTVDKMTGQVTSYNGRYGNTEGYPPADGVLGLDAAKAAYLEKLGMELVYKSNYDYEQKKLTVFPAYVIESYNMAIDAVTGEVINLGEEEYRYANNAAKDEMATASGGGAPAPQATLSPEELAAVEQIAGLLTREQAADKAGAIVEDIGGMEVRSANLFADRIDTDKYIWQMSFAKMEGDKETGGASASVDAKTGELLSFNVYMGEPEGDKHADEQTARSAAESFLKQVAPEKFAASEEAEDVYDIMPLAKPENEEAPDFYNFTYVRQANGIPFESNSLRVTYDCRADKVTSYSSSWYDSAEFPSVEGVKSAETVFDAAADGLGYGLQYRVFGEKKLLVYDFGQGSNAMYDPFTSQRIRYDGKPYVEDKAPEYTDIAGHWCADAANKLLENGIYFARDEIRPDEQITQADFLSLLYRADSRYMPDTVDELYDRLESMGVVHADEKAPDAAVARKDAMKFVVRMLGYDEIAQLEGIYIYPFGDSVEEAYKGYITLAAALGIVNGDAEGNFNPDSSITNAETIMIVYNMLTRETLA